MRFAGMAGVPIGLDFTAIMLTAAAQAADLELLSETLPDFEAIIVASLSGDGAPSETDEEEP